MDGVVSFDLIVTPCNHLCAFSYSLKLDSCIEIFVGMKII